MNDTNDHQDDEFRSLRSVLQSAPKVHASPDFEERLRRRIGDVEKRSENLLGRLFTRPRIPVFVYSLMTLAVVGVISYYMFLRTGVAPTDLGPPVEERNEIPDVQEMVPGQTPPIQDRSGQSQPEISKDAVTNKKETRAERNTPGRIEPFEKRKVLEAPHHDAGGTTRLVTPQQPSEEMNAVREANEAPVPESKSVEPSPVQMSAPEPSTLMKQSRAARQQSRSASAAFESVLVDSASIRDSIKADSLKRRQQLLLQKRAKKPKF